MDLSTRGYTTSHYAYITQYTSGCIWYDMYMYYMYYKCIQYTFLCGSTTTIRHGGTVCNVVWQYIFILSFLKNLHVGSIMSNLSFCEWMWFNQSMWFTCKQHHKHSWSCEHPLEKECQRTELLSSKLDEESTAEALWQQCVVLLCAISVVYFPAEENLQGTDF